MVERGAKTNFVKKHSKMAWETITAGNRHGPAGRISWTDFSIVHSCCCHNSVASPGVPGNPLHAGRAKPQTDLLQAEKKKFFARDVTLFFPIL
jgi:hypothetical protein